MAVATAAAAMDTTAPPLSLLPIPSLPATMAAAADRSANEDNVDGDDRSDDDNDGSGDSWFAGGSLRWRGGGGEEARGCGFTIVK